MGPTSPGGPTPHAEKNSDAAKNRSGEPHMWYTVPLATGEPFFGAAGFFGEVALEMFREQIAQATGVGVHFDHPVHLRPSPSRPPRSPPPRVHPYAQRFERLEAPAAS